jgi:LacI family transcriptional regulator
MAIAAKPNSGKSDSKSSSVSKGTVNMRTIAAKLGISAQTVSLAIRNAPGVSASMRAKVLTLMDELGYRPQPALSALMGQIRRHSSNRSVMKMAFVNSWNEPLATTTAEPLRHFYLGARDKAEKLGYVIEEFRCGTTQDEQAKLRKRLRHSGADGLLIFPTIDPTSSLMIDWEKYSVVEIGQSMQGVPLTLLISDHFGNAFTLCQRLLEEGFQRIGFIHETKEHERIGGSYLGGVLAASFLNGHRQFVEPLSKHHPSPREILRYVKDNRCDALIVSAHFDPQFLTVKGFRAGLDISFFACGPWSTDRVRGIAGIDECWKEVGEAAATQLGRLMQSGTRGYPEIPEVIHIPGRWIDQKLHAPVQAAGTVKKSRRG